MKLVEDARDAWRWHSVRLLAVLAALPLAWAQMPDDAKAFIPETWEPWIFTALAVAGIVGRVMQQPVRAK